jgi:hypothetical protein
LCLKSAKITADIILMIMKSESMNKKIRFNIALSLALLFHISGLIGILFTTIKTGLSKIHAESLLLMALLIGLTHPAKDKKLFVFFIVAFVIGFIAEAIG